MSGACKMQLHADFAVTLGCEGRCPHVPTHVEDWALPDPAGLPLSDVRVVRDEIAGRVDDLVLRRAEEVRADAVLSRYDDARVRSHIATLAVRRTRACLRAPGCAELEAVR